ncbi:hypothetical protein AAG570_000171 [Ranatra chinensis]|uniref:Uncharacterized protein n=1 Tax=Ranatra chinensis TaxID=642074 RepID=A0ABD0YYG0_9HEMI
MAFKRRNMFYENKKQKTREIASPSCMNNSALEDTLEARGIQEAPHHFHIIEGQRKKNYLPEACQRQPGGKVGRGPDTSMASYVPLPFFGRRHVTTRPAKIPPP